MGIKRRWRTILLAVALVSAGTIGIIPGVTARVAAATPVRVMPLGDSITEGRDQSPGAPTYRFFLWEMLDSLGAEVDFVGSRFGVADSSSLNIPPDEVDPDPTGIWDKDHEGHRGWTADDLLNGNPDQPGEGQLSDWMTTHDPEVVLMHAGSNNIFVDGEANPEIIDDLTGLVAAMRAANPNVVVIMSTLIGSANTLFDDQINELNPQIRTLAASLSTAQSPVILSDAAVGFDTATMLYDNVHPNPLGQRHIADAFGDALINSGAVTNVPTTADCPLSTEEGENAEISGTMEILTQAGASGGQIVGTQPGNTTRDPSFVTGAASICVQAPSAGLYTIEVDTLGVNNSQNSFFFSIDASVFGLYNFPSSPNITVGDPLEFSGGPDPLVVNLTAGDHRLNFLAREGGAGIDRVTLVPASGNQPPIPLFSFSCTTTTCSFDATASNDVDGTVASYSWDFGDGNTATGPTTNNAYPASGNYDATLTVTDNDGSSASLTQTVAVADPNDPVAAFTFTCTELTCDFDASGSTDADGTIASYDWTFGDASIGTGQAPTHTFSATGTYAVELTVTDDEGNTGTVSDLVTTVGPLTCDTNTVEFENGDRTGTVEVLNVSAASGGQLVRTLQGSGNDFGQNLTRGSVEVCVDVPVAGEYTAEVDFISPNGGSNSWWFVVNGGSAEAFSTDISTTLATDLLNGTTSDPTVLALGAGNNIFTFYVREDGASLDRMTLVPLADPNDPVAVFTSACSGLTCDFSAADSSDADGTIVSYEWDFGDGSSAFVEAPFNTFATAGSYDVTLTVTDDEGNTGSVTESVTVAAPLVCDVGSTEFESGTLTGSVVVSTYADSSGGSVVRSAQGTGNDTAGLLNRGSVEVCVNVEAAGEYTVDLDLASPNNGSNSWWWQVNSGPVGLFSSELSVAIFTEELNDQASDPAVVALSAGDNIFTFYVREDGASLDRLTLVPTAAPTDPVAAFTSTCADLQCDFDALGSSDLDGSIVSYNWDFGDGATATGATPSHSFAATGTYDVTLTVTDDGGNTGSVTQAVSASAPLVCDVGSTEFESGSLTGNLVVSSYTDASNGLVVRSAQGTGNDTAGLLNRGSVEVCLNVESAGDFTVDLDLASPNSGSNSWWWQVDGGPVGLFSSPLDVAIFTDQLSSSSSDPVVLSLDAGDHIFTFYVREDGASLDRLTLVPAVNPSDPVAAFTSVCSGLSCDFDASESSDPDGSIVSYDWDFGDGSTATGLTPTATFAAAGTYDITLVVTDDAGNTGSLTESVTTSAALVCGAGSAEFESGNVTGTMTVAADASASAGQVVQSANGSGNDLSATLGVGSVSVCVTVDSTDVYTANVGVSAPDASSSSWWYQVDGGSVAQFDTDIVGAIGIDELNDVGAGNDPVTLNLDAGDHVFTFYVREDGPSLDSIELVRSTNVAPTASFIVDCNGLDCTFDGAASIDTDGSIASYDWDFGDTNISTGVATANTFAAVGTYDVTLTVTDDEGASDSETRQILVVDPDAPTASFTFNCVGLNCDFDGSASSDTNGTIVSYDWDFGDNTIGAGITPSNTYASGGVFDVVLTVTDDEGKTAVTSQSVTAQVAVPCAATSVEFEDGLIEDLVTEPLLGASNGAVVASAQGSGNDSGARLNRGSVEVCVIAAAAGDYTVDIDFVSPNGGSNSWWYTVNNGDVEQFSTPISADLATGQLTAAGTNGPVVVSLNAGENRFKFWVREDGASLDVLTLVSAGNQAPVASFTSACDGLVCSFDATGSTDADGSIVSYNWDFGDGSTGLGETTELTFPSTGTYAVTLSVTDDLGAVGSVVEDIIVLDVADPTALFTESCSGLDCVFDGSSSVAPNGTIDAYAWDFGDGSIATGATASHTYASAGTYDVTLTVTDDAGNTGAVTQPVEISAAACSTGTSVEFEDGELTGTLQVSPFAGASGGDVVGSLPGTGNDKSANLTVGSVTVCVSAPQAGEYTVDVGGIAPSGGSNSWWWSLDGAPVREFNQDLTSQVAIDQLNENGVSDPVVLDLSAGDHVFVFYVRESGASLDNLTLVPSVEFNDPTAAFTSACTELACTFDGSGSSDVDGTISSYAWTFGDGASDTGVSPAHTYAEPGTYDVTLVVVDDSGATGSVTNQVTVTGTPNDPPAAVGTSICTDLVCDFDGSDSTDGDGSIVSYQWDFGDGNTASGPTASNTYAVAGSYSATLTVTDDSGASDTVTIVTVATDPNNEIPVASFTQSCSDLECTFDGANSSDADGSIVSYEWEFGDGSTSTGVNPTHTYLSGGTFDVSLTVTDDAGSSAVETQSVTVTDSSGAACPANSVEFESGEVSGTVIIEGEASASGGQWVTAPQGSGNDPDGTRVRGSVTVCVQAPNPGTYTVDLDLLAPNSGSNSWFFSVNGSPARQHSTNSLSAALQVDELNHDNVADPLELSLNAGDNTFVFWPREDGGALDRLTLVPSVVSGDPVAVFSDNCTGLTCSFDGSSSFDSNGQIVSYTWSFGDGTAGSGANPSRTYDEPGAYDVTLVVVDNEGNSNSVTSQIEVFDPNGPTASFTQVCVDTVCDFDATGSTDPDGTIVSWEWDFGDGATAVGVSPSHTYALSGTYEVSLTVTDNSGASQTTTVPVAVVPPGCGTLEAEAENGILDGNFIATTDDGRDVVVAPQGTGSSSTSFAGAPALGYVEVCLTVEVQDRYQLLATLRGPNNGDNSFWVTVDNHLNGSIVNFRYEVTGSAYEEFFIRRYDLAPGDHTVRFWVREDGSYLDSVRLVPDN